MDVLGLWCTLSLLCAVSCHIYTSVDRMKRALQVHLPGFITSLHEYIEVEERRIQEIKRILEDMNKQQETILSATDISEGDPVYYYKFSDVFAINWQRIQENTGTTKSKVALERIMEHRANLPTAYDSLGIMDSITRTQSIYDIKATDLVNGSILGRRSMPLSATDCFNFSKRLMRNSNTRLAVEWLNVTSTKIQLETEDRMVSDYNDIDRPLNMQLVKASMEILQEKNTSLWNKLPHLIEVTINSVKKEDKKTLNSNYAWDNAHMLANRYRQGRIRYVGEEMYRNLDQYEMFENLCKSKLQILDTSLPETNKCFYARHPHYFYKLRKIKVELLAESPLIVLIHNIISDREIELLKATALQNLKRSELTRRNSTGVSENRISESAYVNESSYLTLKLDAKIGSMLFLNLKTETTEAYKITNYGPGGIFNLHFDFWMSDEGVKRKSKTGSNRLYTLLTYLSGVEYGGKTVFPRLGIAIEPIKGSLLLFENLNTYGERSVQTLHASCPVIFGSKWISSKYVHRFGQHRELLQKLVTDKPLNVLYPHR